MANEKVRFGPFELDPRAGELRHGSRRVRLQEKSLKVLEALLGAPGEVVTREELRTRLWPANLFVDFDNGLNNAVNKLRTVLADSATAPKYIETVGRRGYRFIGTLVPTEADVARPDESTKAIVPAAETKAARGSEAVVQPTPPARDQPSAASAASPAIEPVAGSARRAVAGQAISLSSPGAAVQGVRERSVLWSPRRLNARLALVVVSLAVVAVIVANMVAERDESGGAVPRIDSLAVLPLENLSSDPEQEYFSDGMTDALISQLAGIRSLRVISRQSVMQYKDSAKAMPDIARELGVSGVIEGTVQKVADRVRISVQLIHAPSDRHVWAAEYSRPLDDVIELQYEIARTVAHEVVATLTPEETARLARTDTVDPQAYDLYLRGRFFWEKRTELYRALDYFERAIAIEPDFARAHAAVADIYGPLGYGGSILPVEAARKRRAAAERALEIDPDLVEGLASLGANAAFHEWKWTEGERHFLRALEVNPNYVSTYMWYGLWFENQGRQAENLRMRQRAFELDPLNGATVAGYANALFLNGRRGDALDVLQRTLELDPDHSQLLGVLAQIYLSSGRYEEAIELYRRGEGPDLGYAYGLGLGGLGYAYGVAGRRDEALAVLAELERRAQEQYVAPHHFALVQLGLGDTSATLDALERGFEIRDTGMSGIKVAPVFAPLRSEPRFIALLEKMGLQ